MTGLRLTSSIPVMMRRPELLFGCHPDVTQDRAGKLGEEALDEIEPGAVDWREGELEAAARSSGEPASGLLRYMSGMIVENQLNRSAGRIGGIKESEEFDELAAAARLSTDALLPASLMLARCGAIEGSGEVPLGA
jgi:hypothetical protein